MRFSNYAGLILLVFIYIIITIKKLNNWLYLFFFLQLARVRQFMEKYKNRNANSVDRTQDLQIT